MNTNEIVQSIKEMPREERMKFISQLAKAASIDADLFSSARPDDTSAYDAILFVEEKSATQGSDMSTESHVKAE